MAKTKIPVQSYIRSIGYITFIYLSVFAVITLWTGNAEFFFYTLALGAFVYIFLHYQPRVYMNYYLPQRAVTSLSILGFLALGGGVISVHGDTLMNLVLIPNILKYQDVLHMMFMFVNVIISYTFLKPYMLHQRLLDTRLGRTMFYVMMILIVSGVGAVIEVVEFFAATFLDAPVGSYTSNALDLLFNLVGAVIATFFLPLEKKDDPITKEEWLEYRDELKQEG
ncbi:MAG: hypothetical protein ABH833_02000 [Parcubacteria group bacterium]